MYFVGLFKHLEDLDLLYGSSSPQGELADDLTLTPPFAPPLGGRLRLTNFRRVGLLRDMIDLFGGIQFYFMDLFNVDGMPLLLDACAKTLKTLVLWPSDPHGKQLSPEGVHLLDQRFCSQCGPLRFRSILDQVPSNNPGHSVVYRSCVERRLADCHLNYCQACPLNDQGPFIL